MLIANLISIILLQEKLFVVFLASVVLIASNLWLGGYLFSYRAIGSEIAAPPEALHEWHLDQRAPFEYRLLFPAVVNGLWRMTTQTNTAFYWSYVGVSFACGIGAALAFFQLLLALEFSSRLSLAGVVVFLLLPPFLLAYTLPVHTREDTLGYLLLCLGLLLLVRKQYVGFVLISVAGACCRETLLILPLVLLFFTRDLSFLRRALLASPPIVVWALIRVLVDTNRGSYDPLDGLEWNLNNPAQVIGFAFITFGPLWIGWIDGRNLYGSSTSADKIGLLARSAPWALSLILLSTFLGGVYNEIRLLYLGFPWVITLSLHFVNVHRRQLEANAKTGRYIVYVGGMGIFSILVYYGLATNFASFVGPIYYDVPVQTWLAVFSIMLFITLAVLPLYWLVNKRRPLSSTRYD